MCAVKAKVSDPFYKLYGERRQCKRTAPYPAGLTQQHQKDISDINYIMGQYHRTGMFVGNVNPQEPRYGDFSMYADADYSSHLNIVLSAQRDFEHLPAALRRFYNDDVDLYLKAISAAQSGEIDPILYEYGIFDKPVESPRPVTPLDVTGLGDKDDRS